MKDSYGTYDGRREEPPYETGEEAMSDTTPDQWDELAERLLPCEWTLIGQRDCSLIDKSSCITCERRPAVAAELRKLGERIEELEAELEE